VTIEATGVENAQETAIDVVGPIIMNHDSGFIIRIAHVFCKNPNRTHI